MMSLHHETNRRLTTAIPVSQKTSKKNWKLSRHEKDQSQIWSNRRRDSFRSNTGSSIHQERRARHGGYTASKDICPNGPKRRTEKDRARFWCPKIVHLPNCQFLMSHEQECHQCKKSGHLSEVWPNWLMLKSGEDVKWFCGLDCLKEFIDRLDRL